MKYAVRSFVGLAVLCLSTATLASAPVPAGAGADDYFPLKPKSKWVYKVGDQTMEVEFTGMDKDEARFETKLMGKVVATESYQVKPDGVYRVKIEDDKIEPPIRILKLPVKKDETWKFDSKITGQVVKGEFKVKDDKAKLSVMGKEIETVEVDGQDIDINGSKFVVKMWFAKNFGMVKVAYTIAGVDMVLELKEYVEGK